MWCPVLPSVQTLETPMSAKRLLHLPVSHMFPGGALFIPFKNAHFIFTTWLTVTGGLEIGLFQLSTDVPFSLSLTISSFNFKVDM